MSAILLKLQPNQDVTEALETAVRDAGMERARIVAAVGSLVEAVVQSPKGLEVVPGPAIEVAALTGEVCANGCSRLHGYMIRQDTGVVHGDLVRGRNAVGVTFELLLTSMDGAR
ncbi:MAG: DUF296 domain-containing protein [Sphingomonas adhaesiva]|uniref:PCC domain-containing protein n=1 Tax=Sphingomonas adhaesiva TaxID=28212 RepID=UPI002FF884B8